MLAAIPQLYQTVNGVPYIAWSSLPTSRGGQLLLACVPFLGAAGILRLGIRPSSWKRVSLLVSMMALGIVICKGEAQPLPVTGLLLTRLPMGSIFGQPLNNFGVLIVLPLSLFVGFGLAAVLRVLAESGASVYRRVADVSASAAFVGALAVILAPWWTSHVFPRSGGVFPSGTTSCHLSTSRSAPCSRGRLLAANARASVHERRGVRFRVAPPGYSRTRTRPLRPGRASDRCSRTTGEHERSRA